MVMGKALDMKLDKVLDLYFQPWIRETDFVGLGREDA